MGQTDNGPSATSGRTTVPLVVPWAEPEEKEGDGVVEGGRHGAGMGRNVCEGCSQSQREPSQQQQQNYVSRSPRETLKKGGSRQEAGRRQRVGVRWWEATWTGGQGWSSQCDPPADRMTSWLERGECLLPGDRGPLPRWDQPPAAQRAWEALPAPQCPHLAASGVASIGQAVSSSESWVVCQALGTE